MRAFFKASLAAIVLSGLVSTASAGIFGEEQRGPCMRLAPPFKVQEPNVDYVIRYSPTAYDECGKAYAIACAGQYAPGRYVIWVAKTFMGEKFTDRELACVIRHEKAHLPPNNWNGNHVGRSKQPRGWSPTGWQPVAP